MSASRMDLVFESPDEDQLNRFTNSLPRGVFAKRAFVGGVEAFREWADRNKDNELLREDIEAVSDSFEKIEEAERDLRLKDGE